MDVYTSLIVDVYTFVYGLLIKWLQSICHIRYTNVYFCFKEEIKILNAFKVECACSGAVSMVLSLWLVGAQPPAAAGWLRLSLPP